MPAGPPPAPHEPAPAQRPPATRSSTGGVEAPTLLLATPCARRATLAAGCADATLEAATGRVTAAGTAAARGPASTGWATGGGGATDAVAEAAPAGPAIGPSPPLLPIINSATMPATARAPTPAMTGTPSLRRGDGAGPVVAAAYRHFAGRGSGHFLDFVDLGRALRFMRFEDRCRENRSVAKRSCQRAGWALWGPGATAGRAAVTGATATGSEAGTASDGFATSGAIATGWATPMAGTTAWAMFDGEVDSRIRVASRSSASGVATVVSKVIPLASLRRRRRARSA